jgi:hypothetical protein
MGGEGPGVGDRERRQPGCRQQNGSHQVVSTTLPMLERFWM